MDELVISCGSIELRRLNRRHAHQVLHLASDERLTRYLTWPTHRRLDDSIEFIERSHQLWATGESYLLGIFDRERSDLLGSTGVVRLERENWMGEVGTWMGMPFQGLGLNRLVKAATLHLGFELLGLRRLEFLVRVDNERSVRSMTALPGVQLEATLRQRLANEAGELVDANLYAALRSDWQPTAHESVDVRGAYERIIPR